MRTMTTTQAQKNFGDLVVSAIKEPISVTKHTKEVFVIMPSHEYLALKRLHELLKQSPDQPVTNKSDEEILETLIKTLEKKERQKRKASSYFGAAKGLFKSVEEVDDFIAKERASWK